MHMIRILHIYIYRERERLYMVYILYMNIYGHGSSCLAPGTTRCQTSTMMYYHMIHYTLYYTILYYTILY